MRQTIASVTICAGMVLSASAAAQQPQTPPEPAPAPAAAPAAATPAAKAPLRPIGLYGIVDVFVTTGDYGNGTRTRVDSNGARASRLGLRGGKEITDDLSVQYTYEMGLDLTHARKADRHRVFNRQAWVSLVSEDYGMLRVGRQNTPQFIMLGKYDAMDATTQSSGLLNLAPFVPRYSRLVSYFTPKIAGAVTLQAHYGMGERLFNGNRTNSWHVAAEYEKGPVGLGVTHEHVKDLGTATVETDYTLAGGSYDFGRFKVFGGYHHVTTSNASREADTYSTSVLYRMTPVDTLSLGFSALSDRLPANNDASQIGLLYQRFLRPQTVVYAGVARIDNRNAARFTLNGSAVAGTPLTAPGFNPQALQLGFRHAF